MNWQVIKNRVKKVFAYTITSVLFLLVSAFLILQMPPVQSRLISYYLRDFSTATGFTTSIKSFKMLWFDRLELNGVEVVDPSGNKMIRAGEILINFKLAQLLDQTDINIDGIYLDSAHVFLSVIPESDTSRDLNINIFIANINENFSSGGGGGKQPKINIGEAILNQSQFTYINNYRDSIKQGFNYNQFSVGIDEAQLNGFAVIGDTTEFDVKTLLATDLHTKFKINQLSTFFRISQKGMEFTKLNLRAGESVVQDSIVFLYDRQLDLNDFVNKVTVRAKLKNTILHQNDLALFAPGIERINKPIHFNGNFNGRINKFKITDMDAMVGNTRLRGSLDMDGLPELTETFIIVNVRNSQLDPRDISFVLNDQILERLRPMGILHVDGQFLGYPSDFVANGTFIGKLGTIKSDINFKVNEKNFNLSDYSGKLALSSFSLGRYFGDTAMFQQVALDGKIEGRGLTLKTADFKLDGRIKHIGINGYNYRNITTDARFASELFSGFLKIDDPNLEFEAKGSVDLREGRNRIQVEAFLDTAYLHHLRLSKEEIFLHSAFEADVKGLTLDSLEGIASFNDVSVRYKDKALYLNEVGLYAGEVDGERFFNVNSTLLDTDIRGNYILSNLVNDIEVLAKEISLNIKNDKREISDYYEKKDHRPDAYEAHIDIVMKNIKPLTDLFNVNLKLTENTKLQGRFTSGYTTIFNAYSMIDSLEYDGTLFVNTDVELTASKIADSTAVLAMATINSEHQRINKNLSTKNLLAEGIWSLNHIDFGLDADQVDENNYIRLSGDVDFLSDSTVISFDPSMVKLLEREWVFGDNNFVSISRGDFTFNDLSLITGQQSVALNGRLSDNPSEILTLNIDELDLSIFNVLTAQKVAGIMDARIDVSNFFKRAQVQNSINVKDFTVSDFLIGDVEGTNLWDTTANKFDIKFHVTRNDHRLVNIDGQYTPSIKESPLSVTATLEKADLKILEPFLVDIFPRIGGTVSGDFKITGKLDSPAIDGEGNINDGQIVIGYLKTQYRFTGIIGLSPKSIYFKDIILTDALRNQGQLSGAINHVNFNSMNIDISADFKNLQVLNTTIKDNSLFYGQAYATGNVTIFGPISNLRIASTAKTDRNTRIYIPINESNSVEKKEFISFVNFNDTTITKKTAKVTRRNKINLTGLTFDLNLDVTPDAYCEIIFDLKAGDIIRGRGNGDLKLQLDTKGEFNMFGPFEFTEGWYNFTLYDIINKEFEIKKGSKITWYGDPYQGILDINASYNQQASLAPLLQSDDNDNVSTSPQLRRKYPVQVLLKIEGLMLAFQISFDILANDLPKNVVTENGENLDIIFNAFKAKLDEQELKRQVFSLIVLRRFSPPEAFNTSGSVVNSVSELLSNQLSYWMSQVDQNLEIDVDLGVMDDEAFNTFQLRFSYTFLGGRLRVTGDGTFNNTNGNASNANQANQ